MRDLAEVRAEFPACSRGVYLNAAGRAPMADRVAAELERYLTTCREEGARKELWLERVEGVREQTAALLGTTAAEISFTKNTSDGLNTIGHSLGLRSGDNIVILPELEHANNVFPWTHLRNKGVEVRCARASYGAFDLEAMAELCDERTRLISVSAVSFVTGARVDLPALSDLCRARGIFLLVDAAQALGFVDARVDRLGVDALAAGTQKGLLGMYGLGVLYCRKEWIPRLQPPFLARNGVDNGTVHESSLGDMDRYQLHRDGRRFEVGNPNFAGLFALDAALSLLHEVGVERIERHVLILSEQLMDGVVARGLSVVTPRAPERRAGIISFEHPSPEELVRRLAQRGVCVSARRGYVRASFHLYNDESDVAVFLRELEAFK